VRKSGVHTRTAYKLIPVPPLKKRGTREKESESEREERRVKPKKEAIEVREGLKRERKRRREEPEKTGWRVLLRARVSVSRSCIAASRARE